MKKILVDTAKSLESGAKLLTIVAESLESGLTAVVDCGCVNRVFQLAENGVANQLAYEVIMCAIHAPWSGNESIPTPEDRISFRDDRIENFSDYVDHPYDNEDVFCAGCLNSYEACRTCYKQSEYM